MLCERPRSLCQIRAGYNNPWRPVLTSLNTRCSRSSSSRCTCTDAFSMVYFHSSRFCPPSSILQNPKHKGKNCITEETAPSSNISCATLRQQSLQQGLCGNTRALTALPGPLLIAESLPASMTQKERLTFVQRTQPVPLGPGSRAQCIACTMTPSTRTKRSCLPHCNFSPMSSSSPLPLTSRLLWCQ